MNILNMSQCAGPYCCNPALKKCSACLKVSYCSSECQKSDWKGHKKICKILKRLSNDLQPYHEVEEVIIEILNTPRNARVLNELLKYAEYQFGDRVPGKAYRQRGNSERIDNYQVEINIMICIDYSLINVHLDNGLLSIIDCHYIILPYYEKMLELLKPWSLCVDLDAANGVDILNKDQIHNILRLLSETERNVAVIYQHRNQFIIAENHHQRAISYARQYNEEGETKTTLLLEALIRYCELRIQQGDFEGGVQLAEDAYNCVAVAYDPVHPQVPESCWYTYRLSST
jgi:hypothetical protein